MLKNTLLGTLVVGMLLVGCGSNSDSKSDAGSGKGGSGANAGTGGTTGGSGGSTGGTGGTGLTCDTTVMNVDKCGTETCTAPGNVGGMNTCQVSCCTADNKCGQKNTAMQFMGTAYGTCRESAKEDKRCQKVLDSVDTGGLPITLTPCCTDTGLCGGSFNGTSCFDLAQGAMQFGGTAPSVKCVDAENWTPDSGTSGNDAGL